MIKGGRIWGKSINRTGEKIRRLTLIEYKKIKHKNITRYYYYCKCDCGNELWIRADSLSGYTGVTWDKLNKKWYAYITFKKKNCRLGSYLNKEFNM